MNDSFQTFRSWRTARATPLPAGAGTAARGQDLDRDRTNGVAEVGGLGAKAETETAGGEDLGRLETGKRARENGRRSASERRRACRRSRGIV